MMNRLNSIFMLSLHGYVGAEPELGKPDTGGQVVYVLELAKRFSRLGYRVDLVTRRFEDQPEFDEVNDNFQVWRIPFGGKKFIRKEDMHDHIGDFVTNCLAAIRNRGRQYEVVYSHYWDAGWAGQKIAEELDIPHVHTPHSLGWWKQHNMGVDMDEQEMEQRYRFKERIRKEFLVYRNCDHIIATTEPQTELLQKHYDVLERHVTTIPPGMDENRFSPVRQAEWQDLQQRYNLRGHDVLTVGRMAMNKGYDLLLQALPTLLTLVPDARLNAAIGSENSEQDEAGIDQLKSLTQELGITDKVEWVKYIPDEDLANYYRAAGVFALPSRYEPFGMAAIEAMACGTSSVVTVHGGLSNLIEYGKHALFADPNRPVEFGAMLAMPMLYPNLAHELSVEGSRFARRNFGWTGIARRILTIFEQIQMAAKQGVS
ncbi:MAG: mannosylfructose-phosphate synthase [Chloroflexota bacterium]|nr:MAG: mannosylfructose-phosphate synthase [Chloroflexota bacterium]